MELVKTLMDLTNAYVLLVLLDLIARLLSTSASGSHACMAVYAIRKEAIIDAIVLRVMAARTVKLI